MKFKIGDMVFYTGTVSVVGLREGVRGIVRHVTKTDIGVDWDLAIRGHTLKNNSAITGHGWYVPPSQLTLFSQDPDIKSSFSTGQKVVCTRDVLPITKGMIGIVKVIDDNYPLIGVWWDDFKKDSRSLYSPGSFVSRLYYVHERDLSPIRATAKVSPLYDYLKKGLKK